jgi:hypothetical protein
MFPNTKNTTAVNGSRATLPTCQTFEMAAKMAVKTTNQHISSCM